MTSHAQIDTSSELHKCKTYHEKKKKKKIKRDWNNLAIKTNNIW